MIESLLYCYTIAPQSDFGLRVCACVRRDHRPQPFTNRSYQLLKGTVDGRANFGASIKVDRGDGTFTDTFGSHFEFLNDIISPTENSKIVRWRGSKAHDLTL